MTTRLLITLMNIILLFACKENSTEPNQINRDDHIIPLAIGNQWIYYQSVYTSHDTLTVERSEIINGFSYYYLDGDDDYTFGTKLINYRGNELWGILNPTELVDTLYFDESIFTNFSTEKVTVPAGSFDCYKYTWGSWNDQTNIYWFAKGVGVVKAYVSGNYRDLTEYKLN